MRNNILNSKHNNNNNGMESFYEDGNVQYVPTTAAIGTTGGGNGNGLKRPATLELNPGAGKARKTRYNQSVTIPSVLPSPDMQLLKLVSPELDKIITHNAALPTPTPSTIIFPPSASAEQQQFAKGFEDALLSIHKKDTSSKMGGTTSTSSNNNNNNSSVNSNNNTTQPTIIVSEHQQPLSTQSQPPLAPPTTTSMGTTVITSSHNGMSGGEMTYTNLDNYPGVVKEEPIATASSPPVSPIDMESQERIKLERKRLRNRVAASKCRRRKLERISKLEDKVKDLKTQNSELGSMVCNLKQHIFQLKQQVLEHHNSGCTITLVGKF
ncbi:transcription factor Jra [Anopheles aquasalis]|uniref:transcription factor Jra n=1 Tax=Anopheles aquasalis TaxID=42839 RepID=UPI00215A5483|nr:transcription factor Jra [Anopheles aquasalis]